MSIEHLDQAVAELTEKGSTASTSSVKPQADPNASEPVDQAASTPELESHTKDKKCNDKKAGFRGLARFHFSNGAPLGAGFHIPTKQGFEPVRRNVAAQVSARDWYLNGLRVMLGTTASGADQDPRVTVNGVEGAITRAVDWINKMAIAATKIDPDGRYNEGRPYQFGVSMTLSREDYRALTDAMHKPTQEYRAALAKAGARTEVIRAVIYNERGLPVALAVKFKDRKAGGGIHFIYLHATTLLGGGKSDLSLREGDLAARAEMLSREYEWWITALERGNGKIVSIEDGLGGTARDGLYALLIRRIPHRLIAEGTTEYVNVDEGRWVENNLKSKQLSYNANYTTKLLRGAWGSLSKQFERVPMHLIDRQHALSREVRDLQTAMVLLRALFTGLPQVSPVTGDVSDPRWGIYTEHATTDNEIMDIYDPVEGRSNAPYEQVRRTRTQSSDLISRQRFERIGLGEAQEDMGDTALALLQGGRALTAIDYDAMPMGMFCVLELLVPADADFGPDLVNSVGEALCSGLRSAGVEYVVTVYNEAVPGLMSRDEILVTLVEDHCGTTLLMAKTDESDPHKRRVLVRNHIGPWTDQVWSRGVKAYNRLLREVIDAHLGTTLSACRRDGELIRAFASHYYSGSYANRPKFALGGKHDRPWKGRSVEDRGDA
jgi:hypothetical protein